MEDFLQQEFSGLDVSAHGRAGTMELRAVIVTEEMGGGQPSLDDIEGEHHLKLASIVHEEVIEEQRMGRGIFEVLVKKTKYVGMAEAGILQEIIVETSELVMPSSSPLEEPSSSCSIPPRHLECDVCHHTFRTKGVLNRHKKKVHGGEFQCLFPPCVATFKNKTTLTKHVKSMHSDDSLN